MRISDGKTKNVVAPTGGVTKHRPYRIGNWNGVAEIDAIATAQFPLNIDPTYEWLLPVDPAATIADGALVYITSANVLNATASGNTLFGKATSAKGGDNLVKLRLLNIA